MRDVLFRGKRVDNGGWVYGYYVVAEMHDKSGLEYFITEESANGETHLIIPETVGQHTGLTDKNGKKIFEGDIIRGALWWQERQKNGVVVFRDGSFGLLWHRGVIEQYVAFTSMCNVEYTVIGNIHDNPELLKGGANDEE